MRSKIFIKVFKEIEYREQFINGEIYFRKCNSFWRDEERARDDKAEGRIFLSPQTHDVYIDGIKIEGITSILTEVNRLGEALICCASELQSGINCDIQHLGQERLKIKFYENFKKSFVRLENTVHYSMVIC